MSAPRLRLWLASQNRFDPVEPAGGAEQTLWTLMARLGNRGHQVELLATSRRFAVRAWCAAQRRVGLPVRPWRVATQGVIGGLTPRDYLLTAVERRLTRTPRPDLALCVHVDLAVLRRLRAAGVPTAVYVCGPNLPEREVLADPGVLVFANSSAMAATAQARFCRPVTWIRPIIDPGRAIAPPPPPSPGQPATVTMINPSPIKGGLLACAVARLLPEVRFRFVSTWSLPPDEQAALAAERATLPNAEWWPFQRDPTRVWCGTTIVLSPSQVQEGFLRVAAEARLSGIPVLASDQPAIREHHLGEAGGCVLLPPDAPAEVWAAELRRMLDPAVWSRLSAAGRTSALAQDLGGDGSVVAAERLFAGHLASLAQPAPAVA